MTTMKPLNLRLDAELITEMKLQAVKENRSVSDIVAELFREYLRKAKTKK